MTFSCFLVFCASIAILSDFPTDQASLIPSGGSCSYEVQVHDETYILRFPLPKDPQHHYSLQQMVDVATALSPILNIEIPHYALSKNKNYIWYRKIEGSIVSKVLFDQMTPEQQDTMAQGLATFIYQMQHALTEEEISQLGIKNEEEFLIAGGNLSRVMQPEELNQRLMQEVFVQRPDFNKELKPFWEFILPIYLEASKDSRFHGIVHNDLHGKNILINKETGQLTGVIDFSLFARGNTMREMRHFYNNFSPKFMELVVRKYCQLSGIEDEEQCIRNVYVFRAYRDFINLAKGVCYPDHSSPDESYEFLLSLRERLLAPAEF